MNKTPKRIAAAIVSLALGLSAGSYAMPMAYAEPIPASAVDLSKEIALNIEKYEGLADDTSTPIAGISYKVERVNLTNALDTAAGWQEVQAVVAAGYENADLLVGAENVFTAVTETPVGGKATATLSTSTNPGFSAGLFLVTEQFSAQYTVSEPFFVALPYSADNGAWTYERTVQPKNQRKVNVSKGVEDAGKTIGQNITYTIDAMVPPTALNRFNIVDALPDDLTGPTDAQAVNVSFSPEIAEVPMRGPDYTVSVDNNTVEVTFTPDGRTKLEAARAANANQKVVVTFNATIASIPANGIIENNVLVQLPDGGEISTDPEHPGGPDPLDPDSPTDPEDPGTAAQTRFGSLEISKTVYGEDGDTAEPTSVAGAEFQLFRCEVDGDGDRTATGNPISAATALEPTPVVATTFVIPADATVVNLYAVETLDWVNGAATDEELCIVETKAPAGLVVNPEPQPVGWAGGTKTADYTMTASVENVKDSIFGQLPDTGGKGALMIIAAGLVVAAAGGTVAVRGNRARKNA